MTKPPVSRPSSPGPSRPSRPGSGAARPAPSGTDTDTMPRTRSLSSMRRVPMLFVVGGPKNGAEFPIAPDETTIGRQNDNTVVLADISVSRHHVTIRHEGTRWFLVDLGSGNGTLLNGEPMEGEAELFDGDVFQMGDSEIRVQLPGPRPEPEAADAGHTAIMQSPPAMQDPNGTVIMSSPPPRPSRPAPSAAPGPQEDVDTLDESDSGTGRVDMSVVKHRKVRTRRLMLMAAGVLVFVLVLGVVKKRQDAARAQQDLLAQEQAAYDEVQGQRNEAYEAGKRAAKAGDFRAAAEQFEIARQADEQLEAADADLKARLEVARREAENQGRFEQLREVIGKGDVPAALALLKQIPEDSYFHDPERLGPAQEQLKAKLPERLQAGQAALAAKDYEAAKEILAQVRAVDPENAEAAALEKAIAAATAPPPDVRPQHDPKRKQDPTDQAIDALKAGQLENASAALQGCTTRPCRTLGDKLNKFRDAFKNLDSEANVRKAFDVLKTIPGGTETPYMNVLRGKVSATLLREGIQAMGADDLPKAFSAFRDVAAADPNNSVAAKHLATLRQKAQETFEEGYYAKRTGDLDKARRSLELVRAITAPDDELNAKAKKHLDTLGNPP